MKKVKIAFAAGFTGTILTGLIAKMPIGNAENIPLCIEGADVAIASGDDTYLTGNCTLNKDFSGNLIVGSNITATLNLNQKNLTSTTGVVLKNLGNLTITGEGSLTGSDNYVFQNLNTATISGGTFNAPANNASIVANGWYDPSTKTAESANYATMYITGGTFNGKVNNVKNDENGIMYVSGGTFNTSYTKPAEINQTAAILHGGKSLEITGGELNSRIVVQTLGVDKEKSLSVSGGQLNYTIAFDTSSIDSEITHDVHLTGGYITGINLPSTVKYAGIEAHDYTGGSFVYSGKTGMDIEVYNLNLSGGFSIYNGDPVNVILRDSTVGQFSSINKGTLNVINVDATSGGYIKSANGTLNIYGGHVGKAGKMIQTTNNGTINIYDGYIYGELTPVKGKLSGTINVFGGRFIKTSEEQTAILTEAVANGNAIAETDKELIEYQDGEETWYFIGNHETSSSIINENDLGNISLKNPLETVGDARLVIIPAGEEELKNLEANIENLKAAYDIFVVDEVDNVIPVENNQIRVQLALAEEYRGYDHYTIAYINEDGQVVETFAATVNGETIEYTTSHLSLYGIIAYNDPAPEPKPEPEPEPEPEPTPEPKPDDSETIVDDDDGPAVPNTADKPSVPNTGYDEEASSRAGTLLWILGFVSVATAGVLALIKKYIKI